MQSPSIEELLTLKETISPIAFEYRDNWASYEKQALDSVIEWKICDDKLKVCPLPLFDILMRSSSGKWKRVQRRWLAEGKEAEFPWTHGFNDQGQMVVVRIPQGVRYLYVYGTDGEMPYVDRLTYQTISSTVKDRRIRLERHWLHPELHTTAKMINYYHVEGDFYDETFSIDEYTYQDSQLIQSSSVGLYHYEDSESPSGPWDLSIPRTFEYEYDSAQELLRVTEVCYLENKKPKRSICYKKLPDLGGKSVKQVIKASTAQIIELLKEEVTKALNDFQGEGPYYCLALEYCGEDIGSQFPGEFRLASDQMRQRVLKEKGSREAAYHLWATPEWDGDIELAIKREGRLSELSDLLLDLTEDMAFTQRVNQLRKILHQLALALNEIDWSSCPCLTEDFVITALDNTVDIPSKNDLKASLPKARFNTLKKSKMLP